MHVPLSELNELLTCAVCKGYYRIAHTIAECNHTFCKACIFKHFHENNIRGRVNCPKCSADLGVYSSNTIFAKVIYDRNLQSVVDRIFPQFASAEAAAEKKFNHDKIEAKKARKAAETDSGQAEKRMRTSSPNTSSLPEKKTPVDRNDSEFHVRVKMQPAQDIDQRLVLPMLSKNKFIVVEGMDVSKVQKFVYRRLSADVVPADWNDIAIHYQGGNAQEPSNWAAFLSVVRQHIDTKDTTMLKLQYSRRASDSN